MTLRRAHSTIRLVLRGGHTMNRKIARLRRTSSFCGRNVVQMPGSQTGYDKSRLSLHTNYEKKYFVICMMRIT